MRDRLRRFLAWCGLTRYASPTYQPIVPRLSDEVPTKAEREATAALQEETITMFGWDRCAPGPGSVFLDPDPITLKKLQQACVEPWPGIDEAVRRARAQGASSYGVGPAYGEDQRP